MDSNAGQEAPAGNGCTEAAPPMFLKRLTCLGFKSFADKTDFDFMPGVTCIVGPNGCGKSNIVDAVKWVLGEQSARSLRGRQMIDVIFTGSGTRKSSGLAQVDLFFDNTDRTLPCDQDEVRVSRRLFRTGESEYLLNGQTCRLKDIRELFLDTGVGVDAYSIIEQGKVDLLLQASSAERRLIFEEAAGISRYKARKKEAIRKLERVEQNLLRLMDIVEEVEKRLRSVKYQAGKARNYQSYAARLRELRASYSLAEYHRLTESDREHAARIDAFTDDATRLRTSINRAEAETAQHDTEIIRLDQSIHETEQRLLTVTAEITAHQERIEQSRQRMAEQHETRSRAQARLFAEQRRSADLSQRIDEEGRAVEAIERQVREQQASVDALHRRDQEMSQQFAAAQQALEDEKAAIIELMRQASRLNNDISALAVQLRNLTAQQERLAERGATVNRDLLDRRSSASALAEEAHALEAALGQASEQLADTERAAQQLDTTRSELGQELAAAKEHRSGLRSRKQLLQDLDRRLEGVDAGVREVLEQKQNDPAGRTFAYVRGMVADLITADVQHAALIEAVIGEADQYLVVADSRAFLNDAAFFADLPGRVHTICLDRLGPIVNERDFSEQPGYVANAADLVHATEDLAHLVRHLLGKTIVVESLDDAVRLAGLDRAGHRFLTLGGQLIAPDGRISVGPAGSHAGLISRKSELREIDQQIADVEARVEGLAAQQDHLSAEAAQLQAEQDEIRRRIQETRTSLVETNSSLNVANEAVRRLEAEQPLIAGEAEAVARELSEAGRHDAEYRTSLEQIERQNVDCEAQVASINRRIAEIADERTTCSERLTQARVEAGQLQEKRAASAESQRSLRASQQAALEAVREAQYEAEACRQRVEQLERGILAGESRLAELFGDKEALASDALAGRRQREGLRRSIEDLAAAAREHRAELESVEAQLHEAQIAHQEVRIRRDELAARVRDDLKIDLAAQYAGYEHAEQNWESVESEITELRQKIERLGNVNLDAISEQEELEQRAAFLTGQRDDLTESRKQLEELIERLNAESRDRFQKTFDEVRQHFQELFRKLFGGGKADVLLESPDGESEPDILEAGIEIQARPPGKELRSISLLSGGEKTMTAIALLLAIFRSRPSPFAVLDEVDAALDEANNERFNRIIHEFLSQSQFILITHSKRTMTIADILYGVTMQEAGVSKRVSVKFEDESRDSTPAVA
jgi:chromosome segregation protein